MVFFRFLDVALHLILFGTCTGSNERKLICKKEDCSESISTCNEPFEAHRLVEETPYMISPEDFYYKFMAKHKPIVFRKAASNWPASKMWTELYFMQSVSDGNQLVTQIKDFPFGLKMHITIKDFLSRSQQEDLMMFNWPSVQMLNDITAPLCLKCPQFMNKMKVFYWLRKYQKKATTSLYLHPHEQMLAVVNGSAQVTLVSSLYSDELPHDENQLLLISKWKEEILSSLSSEGIPHFTVNLQKGDMLYIPQMWWQLVTLPGDPILFVQFLWPSRMQKSSIIQSSIKTSDNKLTSIQKSIKSFLRRYEERFLTNVVPPLVCAQQDMRMSNYTFETGKMSDEEYQFFHNGPDFTETESCNFDGQNKESPCHFSTCYEDAESTECIRYILDYCNQWEDRGCVIELPQLLNKVNRDKMEEIATMKSPYQ